jgi:hypothetical protein
MTDLELIKRVKDTNDSAALVELVNMHSGIYVDTVNRFSCMPGFANKVNTNDLKDDRMFDIFSWAGKYDPTRGMKFGTYVGEMIAYKCQNLLNRAPESFQFKEEIAPNNETPSADTARKDIALNEIREEVAHIGTPLFRRIFGLRFGAQPKSWREIAEIVGMTHEGVRKHFNKYLPQVKHNLS